ncbi:hypothetical protein DFH08DRAFT_1008469 [Mycena albidolilacea]|uniref:Uncharacterized protein n=1 Tax=Mycena albidolilacea TaxID=1033008 RepID=A0AAD7A080_9AGAR|nr:hypothetical protein DFH08DRAFT_1008469 [Mycena albidolilacea]
MSEKSGFKAAHFFELLFSSVVIHGHNSFPLLLNRELDTRLLVWTFSIEEDDFDFKVYGDVTERAIYSHLEGFVCNSCATPVGPLPVTVALKLEVRAPTTSAGDRGSNTFDTPTATTTSNSTVATLGCNKCYRDISDGTSGNTGTSLAGGGTSPGFNTGISLNSANTALIVAFGQGAQNFLFIGTAGTGSFSVLHSADDVGERVKEPKKRLSRCYRMKSRITHQNEVVPLPRAPESHPLYGSIPWRKGTGARRRRQKCVEGGAARVGTVMDDHTNQMHANPTLCPNPTVEGKIMGFTIKMGLGESQSHILQSIPPVPPITGLRNALKFFCDRMQRIAAPMPPAQFDPILPAVRPRSPPGRSLTYQSGFAVVRNVN